MQFLLVNEVEHGLGALEIVGGFQVGGPDARAAEVKSVEDALEQDFHIGPRNSLRFVLPTARSGRGTTGLYFLYQT
jgi:hypothetical protein